MGVKNRSNGVSQNPSSDVDAKQVKPTEGEPEGYEFGGPLGAMVVMVASPLLMWYAIRSPNPSLSPIVSNISRLTRRAGICGSARHTMMDNSR